MDYQGQSSGSSSVVVEMIPLVKELRHNLETLKSLKSQPEDGIIVAKVRHLMRNVCNSDYDPDYVSIGPYNYHRQLPTQDDKLRSLDAVLSWAKKHGHGTTVEAYINELACLEPEARNCYNNTFDDIPKDQFVRMLLLDGCYILHRFVNFQAQHTTNDAGAAANGSSVPSVLAASPDFQAQPTTNDVGAHKLPPTLRGLPTAANGSSVLSVLAASPDIQAQPTTNDEGTSANASSIPSTSAAELRALDVVRDVFFLAENQIPFFVLEKIGELAVPDGRARVGRSIADHALTLMKEHKCAAPAMVPPEPPTVPGNLLHLLHMHLKPESGLFPDTTGITAADESASVGRWRTATEYNYAGVKFKVGDMSEAGSVRCILDVKLDSSGGTLEVPFLDIDNETWPLLRNLMELEQRNRGTVGSNVTAYCVFMSQLASDSKDVELLRKRGVIVHSHGNDGEVAQHFADLCKGIMFNPNNSAIDYLWETRQKMDRRSRSYPRRWMAWLRRRYFANPWLAVGLLAAAIGLVCALVQSLYSVLSYKHGRN
ncbi:uncharacterized protein LOC124696353 [Lolium rigidum]|uniref:uncharacterized protein LOC124696353 n=1 Tax=Lolium rigidum TaxID=89674 RepID=UPI001F5E0373|nr:uncharacterized protein LOC124696353 [Lolium rigidum]